MSSNIMNFYVKKHYDSHVDMNEGFPLNSSKLSQKTVQRLSNRE